MSENPLAQGNDILHLNRGQLMPAMGFRCCDLCKDAIHHIVRGQVVLAMRLCCTHLVKELAAKAVENAPQHIQSVDVRV